MTNIDSDDDEIFLGLDPGPGPGRPPTPKAPRPLTRVHGLLELAGVAALSTVLAAGLTAWWVGSANRSPTADAVTLGRSYAPKLAGALADGFDADADALKAGKTFAEANKALKKAFHDAAESAFEAHAGAAVTAIIPDNSEIKDQAQRDALEAFHRDFARGLRKAR